jgi:hypothetical protein
MMNLLLVEEIILKKRKNIQAAGKYQGPSPL